MKNNLKDSGNTKNRILNATLYIIGKEGFQNVTIRKIATTADVNVASINYYFGSKDNVINEALKCITSKFITSFKILDDKQLLPIDRLRDFLRSYSDVSVEHPDVFRNFINQLILNENIEYEYMEFLRHEGIEKIISIFKELTDIRDDAKLHMMALQIVGSLIFPILVNNKMMELSNLNYNDKNVRYEYVELLIKLVNHK